MKTDATKDGPDISSIISNLTKQTPGNNKAEPEQSQHGDIITDDATSHEFQGRLWDEFFECLNEEEESPTGRTKLYAIDDDIVETLHQCCFGKPNVHVINCILRTFLVDNIPRLRKMHRPRSISLLDKFQP